MTRSSVLLGILLLLAAGPAMAQRGPTYCNVTEIKTEQLANAVRVIIVTDGTPNWYVDWDRLIREGAMRRVMTEYGEDFWPTESFVYLPIRILNAKSKLGTGFVPINKYPVSHARISIPEWAVEGVGLQVDIVNYLGFWTGEGHLQDARYNLWTMMSEDETSIVISWLDARFPPQASPVTPKDLPSELSVTSQKGLLRVHAVNAELREVTSAIARAANLAVTAPPDGDLRVSVSLEGVTPQQAIEAVATGCGLCTQLCADGSWLVAQPRTAEGGYVASCARTIHLQYLRAADALDLLPNFLLDYIKVDQEANAVIVNGPVWLVARVQDDLAKLDTRPPEVVFEVVAVEYISSEELFRQLDVTRLLGDFSAGFNTLAGGIELLWLEDLPRGWELLLDSRDSKSSVRLSSRGSLRAASGRTSQIFAGQQRFVIVEDVSEQEGISANVEPVSIGTTLELQPRLGMGDEVVLDLELEIRSLQGEDPTSKLPVIRSRQADQTIRVKDGDTILVTGLTLNEVERRERAIPILGQLPLIGSVFRLPDRMTSNTELAVFLTPHIIRDTG